MSDPWQILGLSRDSATEKEVKSAYARLIKQHRPDTDPEGFQRVRQAYEAALALVKNRASFGPPSLGDAKVPEGNGPALPTSTPPDLIEAELAVHRAREGVDTEALAKALAALCPICRSLRPGRAGFQLWRETLQRVTNGRSALLAMGLPAGQLLDELESGSAVITHEVLTQWESARDIDKLRALAEALLAQGRRLHNEDSGIVALRMGLELGFLRPALATRLVTFAFPHIDRQAREQLIPQVEQQVAIGNLMSGLRQEQAVFWHARIRNPRHTWDWNDAASQAALDYLAKETAPSWRGFNLIREVAPAAWFARLEKEMGKRQGGLMGKFRPATLGRLRPQRRTTTGSGKKRIGWVLFLVLMVVVRALPQCRDYSPVDNFQRQPPPPISAWTPKAKIRADKLLQEDKLLHVWIESSNAIGTKAMAEIKLTNDARKRNEIWGRHGNELLKLMRTLHDTSTDQNRERRLLEYLVCSPAATRLERQAALFRMTQVESVDVFLPLWEKATALGSVPAQQIFAAALDYLNKKGVELNADERARMRKLANGVK